jgi:type II secretory pathway pseudopilin PulG
MNQPTFSRTRRIRPAGFTLTELMVAITGGLLLAIAVFALARDSTRFFRQEARAGDATLAAVVGFERLQADIQRAAFMASPNVQSDNRLCGSPFANWPARLKELGALRISDSTVTLPDAFDDERNKTTGPNGDGWLNELDVLTIAGNFTSPDSFLINTITTIGSGAYRVTLEQNLGPLARQGFANSGAGGAGPGPRDEIVKSLFPSGRALRIVDRRQKHYYAEIIDSGFTDSNGAYIDLDNVGTPLTLVGAGSTECGLRSNSPGATANVVNFIRYEIRPDAAALSGAGGAAPVAADSELAIFEQTRTDLYRYEVDIDGAPIGAAELVSEYAVDLRFAVGVLQTAGAAGAGTSTGLAMFDETDRNARAAFTGALALTAGGNAGDIGHPEDIVLVRARLSVRSQMPDRYGGIPDGAGVSSGFYRMWLADRAVPGSSKQREYWARVRTLQADVSLRNSGN